MLVECKDADGRMTKTQEEFIAGWAGRVEIVRGPEEAVRKVLGAAAMK